MKQLIPQIRIDEAAKELADKTYPRLNDHEDWEDDGFDEGYNAAGNRSFRYGFNNGVQFAITEIQPLMIEFKDWCDINERDLRLENISNTNSSAITTEQLLEEFIKRNNKKDE